MDDVADFIHELLRTVGADGWEQTDAGYQWKLVDGCAGTELKSEIRYALAAMRECLIEAEQLLEGRKFERAS